MQFKLFTVPINDGGAILDELNRFLKREYKILEVQKELVNDGNGMYWCFCVMYKESFQAENSSSKVKPDYKVLLDDATFQKFNKLREIRKKVAADNGLPAYVVFTDEELAGIAKLKEITIKNMLGVKGIGDKKVEKFGKYFVMDEGGKNEERRTFD